MFSKKGEYTFESKVNGVYQLRKWYLIALAVIALVVLISHLLMERNIINQLSDSRVINVAVCVTFEYFNRQCAATTVYDIFGF